MGLHWHDEPDDGDRHEQRFERLREKADHANKVSKERTLDEHLLKLGVDLARETWGGEAA